MWHRIENNLVVESTNIDPDGRFHPALIWVPDCGANAEYGWHHENGEFSKNHEELSYSKIDFVTRAQGKAALIQSGVWQGVLDFVDSIEDATEKALAEVALNDTTHWQRSSPFLNSAAQALGLTDKQLDQLFIDASKIEL